MVGRIFRHVATTAFAVLLALTYLLATRQVQLPARFDPTAPLDLRDPPTFLTAVKLSRLRRDPAACQAVLRTATELRFAAVADQAGEGGCGLANAVRVASSGVQFNAGFVASCPLAASWALFERHGLQPAARRHLGRDVRSVQHLGTYACRNIYDRPTGRLSRHATADAIDVAAVTLSDGSRVSLLADWQGGSEARRAFLREVRSAACRFFDVTLSPDYNAAHRNHFHFDLGGGRACR